jgi:hypothetical protein
MLQSAPVQPGSPGMQTMMMTAPRRTTRPDPSRSANAMAAATRPQGLARVQTLAQKQAQIAREKQCPPGQEDVHVPDYPRALFYPLLPWGAPQRCCSLV